MRLHLTVVDVNGVRLLGLSKVQARLTTSTGPGESEQAGVAPVLGIDTPEMSYQFPDPLTIHIVLGGPFYPVVDFVLAPVAGDRWAVDVVGRDEAEKESRRVLARSHVRSTQIVGEVGPITKIVVTMPRVKPAPFGPTAFSKPTDAKPGTLVTRHAGVVGISNTYLDLDRSKQDDIHLVKAELLTPTTDPKAADWDRLQSTKVAGIDPPAQLWFRLVEYGGPQGARFLVALCGPTRGLLQGDGGVDAIVFYSPSTIVPLQQGAAVINLFPPSRFPFRDDYPYAETVLEKKGTVGQPYCSLGFAYLALDGQRTGFKMAYQVLAARKAAVMIMPLWPYGNTGPLRSRAGLWRLVRESVGFAAGMAAPEAVPIESRVNRLAVCGYSAGATFVSDLLSPDKETIQDEGGNGYERALWGSPADDLAKAWKETWMIDATGGMPAVAATKARLAAWAGESENRSFRLYQTQHTVGPTYSPAADLKAKAKDGFARLLGAAPTVNTVKDDKGILQAEEVHSRDGRFSSFYFSNSFLTFPEASQLHAIDAHHAVPHFAVGHAALTSGLGAIP